jgi:hypothetical protein
MRDSKSGVARFESGAHGKTKNEQHVLASLSLDRDTGRCQFVLECRLDDLRKVNGQVNDVLR